MEHYQEILSKHGKCLIKKCTCGSYYISYDCATVCVNKDGMLRLLDIIYTHGAKGEEFVKNNKFGINFGPALLSIKPEDYKDFYNVVDEATSKVLKINELFISN